MAIQRLVCSNALPPPHRDIQSTHIALLTPHTVRRHPQYTERASNTTHTCITTHHHHHHAFKDHTQISTIRPTHCQHHIHPHYTLRASNTTHMYHHTLLQWTHSSHPRSHHLLHLLLWKRRQEGKCSVNITHKYTQPPKYTKRMHTTALNPADEFFSKQF